MAENRLSHISDSSPLLYDFYRWYFYVTNFCSRFKKSDPHLQASEGGWALYLPDTSHIIERLQYWLLTGCLEATEVTPNEVDLKSFASGWRKFKISKDRKSQWKCEKLSNLYELTAPGWFPVAWLGMLLLNYSNLVTLIIIFIAFLLYILRRILLK